MANSCTHRGKTLVCRHLEDSALSPLVSRDRRICHHRAPMPSPVGHTLAGVAVAWAADLVPGDRSWRAAPPTDSWYRRAGNGVTLACALIAALPDLDLLFATHRAFTHSVGAVMFVAVGAAIVARRIRRPVARVALMCAAAYASHLVLDWLAVDLYPPPGLRALWP